MPRIAAAVCAVLFTSTLVGAATAPGVGADTAPAAMVVAPGAEGLAWSARTPQGGQVDGGAIALAVSSEADLGWDLTALEPDDFRSDLLSVALVDVQGPGALTVSALSAFGRRDVLLDSASGPDEAVLQLGRSGTFRWSFTEPGEYRVHLTATVAARGGGVSRVDGAYQVDVAEGADAGVGIEGAAIEAGAATTSGVLSGQARASSASGAWSTSARSTAAGEAAGATAQAGSRVVIDKGHVDMGPRIIGGEWRVQLKDDSVSPLVWRDLADLVLHAHDPSRLEIPAGGAFSFLGSPGSTVYVLPQVQQSDLVWPGWNTQDPSVLAAVPGDVTWRLRGVDGPGRFVLYLAGSFGDTEVLFDTGEALPQELQIGRNTHVHGNWAFTAPGIYRLSVEMAATGGDGTAYSDTRTLTIVVGDATDPNTAFPAGGGDPGGGGSTGGTTGGTTGGGDMDVTAQVPGPGGRGGGGSGPGSMAFTGVDGLGLKLALAALLVGVGWLLVNRSRRIRIKTHS